MTHEKRRQKDPSRGGFGTSSLTSASLIPLQLLVSVDPETAEGSDPIGHRCVDRLDRTMHALKDTQILGC